MDLSLIAFLPMTPNFGFSITARKVSSPHPGVFISGQSWEAGKFRILIPVRKGDWVPVWQTAAEAVAVVEEFRQAPMDEWEFKVCDIRKSVDAGGPNKRGLRFFRGVGGYVIPEVVRPVYRWGDRGGPG